MSDSGNVKISKVGEGKVYLLAGGGRIYSEMVAKFCRTEDEVSDIAASPYLKGLLKSLIHSRHKAALEFDDYIFGIEGYARVTEVQLVRRRHASYNIKSGRVNKHGNRSYDMVLPESIITNSVDIELNPNDVYLTDTNTPIKSILASPLRIHLDTTDLLHILSMWYDNGVNKGIPEEELRYMKPQATEFKAAIKMNAAGLYDWFQIRLCNRAQTEIRDLATKMYQEGMKVHPDIFEEFGPSCKILGYCPESEQCSQCKDRIPTRKDIDQLVKTYYKPEKE